MTLTLVRRATQTRLPFHHHKTPSASHHHLHPINIMHSNGIHNLLSNPPTSLIGAETERVSDRPSKTFSPPRPTRQCWALEALFISELPVSNPLLLDIDIIHAHAGQEGTLPALDSAHTISFLVVLRFTSARIVRGGCRGAPRLINYFP